jgi:hypothetical protein
MTEWHVTKANHHARTYLIVPGMAMRHDGARHFVAWRWPGLTRTLASLKSAGTDHLAFGKQWLNGEVRRQ